MVKKHIAIILARGGSKRIPKKNIIDFHGKPMIAWTIISAIKCKLYDRVLVSTDDEEIATVAKNYGAIVPFLRSHAADDLSTSSEASLFALKQAEEYWDEEYEIVTQLMANCPLRDENDLQAAYQNFQTHNVDSQISCFQFGWMNPWWAIKLDQQFKAEHLNPEALTSRSQDLPALYCPTGATWIAKTQALKTWGTFHLENKIYFPMNWITAIDIDDFHDLEMAKAFYLIKNNLIK